MIDLHTHTTASDGRCAPEELVARAHAAGVTVLSVTDHDTVAGLAAAAAACRDLGLAFVSGIEITAVIEGVDVHVLGYFFDPSSAALLDFLASGRQQRIERGRLMIDKLAAHGIKLDADAVLKPALNSSGRSVGRPWIARALIEGGYVTSVAEAFDRWLSLGRPAFMPRQGVPPAEVFARIHDAGGLASLAHPALVGHDEWIAGFAANGLDAIEVYHSEHDASDSARYAEMARALGLLMSGGSDYHGDDSHGPGAPGSVALPQSDYERLRATSRANASGSETSS